MQDGVFTVLCAQMNVVIPECCLLTEVDAVSWITGGWKVNWEDAGDQETNQHLQMA